MCVADAGCVRLLAFLLVTLVTRTTSASPYDIGWATMAIGGGASPELSGDLGDRLVRIPCDTTCPLSVRGSIGGGIGHVGLELQTAVSPVEDTGATDARDRDRTVFRTGLVARYTLLRRYGFDVSVRGGLQLGTLFGESSTTTMPDPNCPIVREGMCDPIEVRYEPASYFVVAMPLGATVRLGIREPGGQGFFGLFADLDYTVARVSFPGDARTGALRTMTYGVTFGTMFDLR